MRIEGGISTQKQITMRVNAGVTYIYGGRKYVGHVRPQFVSVGAKPWTCGQPSPKCGAAAAAEVAGPPTPSILGVGVELGFQFSS